jgi:ABC-type branched-subunit amino acid transport system substrate-binding protein
MPNRIVKGKRLGIPILAVALAALLLVTACAPAPTMPAGEKRVEVGVLIPLTGGGGAAMQPGFQGLMDYVTYSNEEDSIPGFAIEVLWRDTMTERNPFISGHAWLVDRQVPLIVIASPQDIMAISGRLERDQTPILATAIDLLDPIEPPGWVFGAWSPWGESISVLLDYFMENWKEERPPKLTFFVIDVTFGWEPSRQAGEYAESIGFEVLPFEVGPHVVVDATTQLLRIRESEADLVYIQHIVTGIGPLLRDAERLGLTGEMQFASWMAGEAVINMAPRGAEGLIIQTHLPWFDETEIPGVETFLDKQVEYHGKVVEDRTIMMGWIYGAIVCEAVKLALEEVGYENLDGPAMRRAFENMDFDLDGMARITFGPEDRRGITNVAVYQVQGGKTVRVSDWKEAPILVPED